MLNVEQVLSALFEEAARTTRLDYLYTLVRVEGITQRMDPLIDMISILYNYSINPPQRENILSTYRSLVQNHEPLSLLANLIYCVDNKNFMTQPFFALVKGTFPNQVQPSTSEIVRHLINDALCAKRIELSSLLEECYPLGIVDNLSEV
jgi:hypothetical protein